MFDLKDAKILVVDDNPDNLKLLVNMLKKAGYTARATMDGEMALLSLEKQLPDLILLDINMPEMNGFEVARHLQDNPATRDIPIIFISALGDTQSIVTAFEHGGVDYITKPFQFAEVSARIRTHLTTYFQRQQLLYFNRKDKELLEEIQRSEERYRDLFDNASDIIQSVDKHGYFVYTNRVWHQLLGYTLDDLEHITIQDIVHPDCLVRYLQVLEDVQEKPDIAQNIEIVFLSKTGNELIVQGNINGRNDPERGFHTRGIFRDITQQRQAEKHALEYRLERERNQMLTDFIQDSSHELRTPLTIISQQLYFIKRFLREEEHLQKIALADQQVNALNHIIGQLQKYVKLNAQHTMEISLIDIHEFMKNYMFEAEIWRKEYPVQITFDLADDVLKIRGDLQLLRQAVTELIENAIRYTDNNGQILITARKADEQYVEISVTNQGTEISPDYYEKIFQPLFKANRARTADGSGIGLGLSMVKRIIELHGGYIDITSKNHHTRFRILLSMTH